MKLLDKFHRVVLFGKCPPYFKNMGNTKKYKDENSSMLISFHQSFKLMGEIVWI